MKFISNLSMITVCTLITPCVIAHENSPEIEARVHLIQQEVKADLHEGRIEHARTTLEAAAGNFHAVEIELGLIQTLMQAGEYRHALSAAAHTQAEHTGVIDSALLYAWLLALGGQTNPALKLLETTLIEHPRSDELTQMQTQIKRNQLAYSQLKASDDIQLHPFTSVNGIEDTQKYLVSGVITDNGKKIITPLSDIENVKKINVRDGLGRTSDARIFKILPTAQLAILQLDNPIKPLFAITIAEKPPLPGTPIYLIGFSALNNNQPDWPQLKIDILGTPDISSFYGYPVHARTAARGSGIYNQSGQLIGLLAGDDNKAMLPLTAEEFITYKNPRKEKFARTSMDEIYEASLGTSVQVFGSND